MSKRLNHKIFIFSLYPIGIAPGPRFRYEQYIDFLRRDRFDVSLYSFYNYSEYDRIRCKGAWMSKVLVLLNCYLRLFRYVINLERGGIVFVFREVAPLGFTWFEYFLSKRASAFVFDFDDAIWLQNVSDSNKKYSFLKRPGKTSKLCSYSDLVIVGNFYLKQYADKFAKHVVIIPTTIDTEYHYPIRRKIDNKICIGWTGSASTLKYFEIAIPILKRIRNIYGASVVFKVIVDKKMYWEEIKTHSTFWSKKDEINQLADIDIGIMPLPVDEWSQGKCGFKLLQYMAIGKPVVASPVGVNTEIVQHNHNGYLASKEEEWIAGLSALIDDAHLRDIMGGRGRQKVVAEYSVDSQRERYVGLFRELVK